MHCRKDAAAGFFVDTDRKPADEAEKFRNAIGGELPSDFGAPVRNSPHSARGRDDGLAVRRRQLPQNRVGVEMIAAIETPTHGDGIVEDKDGHARP